MTPVQRFFMMMVIVLLLIFLFAVGLNVPGFILLGFLVVGGLLKVMEGNV